MITVLNPQPEPNDRWIPAHELMKAGISFSHPGILKHSMVMDEYLVDEDVWQRLLPPHLRKR